MKTQELHEIIDNLEKREIDDVLYEVIQRKRQLYPDWEIVYYACLKGDTDIPEEIRSLMQKRG